MAFKTLQEISDFAEENKIPFWQAVLQDDCEENGSDSKRAIEKMARLWSVMQDTVKNYNPEEISSSGLSGTDGEKFSRYRLEKESLCGPLVSSMIEVAIKTGEANAPPVYFFKQSITNLKPEYKCQLP